MKKQCKLFKIKDNLKQNTAQVIRQYVKNNPGSKVIIIAWISLDFVTFCPSDL